MKSAKENKRTTLGAMIMKSFETMLNFLSYITRFMTERMIVSLVFVLVYIFTMKYVNHVTPIIFHNLAMRAFNTGIDGGWMGNLGPITTLLKTLITLKSSAQVRYLQKNPYMDLNAGYGMTKRILHASVSALLTDIIIQFVRKQRSLTETQNEIKKALAKTYHIAHKNSGQAWLREIENDTGLDKEKKIRVVNELKQILESESTSKSKQSSTFNNVLETDVDDEKLQIPTNIKQYIQENLKNGELEGVKLSDIHSVATGKELPEKHMSNLVDVLVRNSKVSMQKSLRNSKISMQKK